MPIVQWQVSYEVNIEEFDRHHRWLVALLNKVYDGFVKGENQELLIAALDALIDYATYHFSAEEHWMKQQGYPDVRQHIQEHERFTRRIVEMQKDFHAGRRKLSLELLQFLSNWITNHIVREDGDYALYVASESACPGKIRHLSVARGGVKGARQQVATTEAAVPGARIRRAHKQSA